MQLGTHPVETVVVWRAVLFLQTWAASCFAMFLSLNRLPRWKHNNSASRKVMGSFLYRHFLA